MTSVARPDPPPASPAPGRRRWRLSGWSVLTAVLFLGGLTAVSYPTVANWFSEWESSQVLENYAEQLGAADPPAEEQLALAHAYNDALDRGSIVGFETRVPSSDGNPDGAFDYFSILSVGVMNTMARLKIGTIDVDLPVYHGTSDAVLDIGVGHLEGTSLPVGGPDTHSVLTAHRGLAGAKLFTDLDRVGVGDRFTIEVLGEVLVYEVFETQVVKPENTEPLAIQRGRDLVTLVTCTPLGINTDRILVTAERVHPTPEADLENAGASPEIPRFPWWIVWMSGGVLLAGIYLWRSGLAPSAPASAAAAEGSAAEDR